MTRMHTPDPHYNVKTWLGEDDGIVLVGSTDIPDPFINSTLVIDRADAERLLRDYGQIRVNVNVTGDRDAMLHVTNPRPIEVEDGQFAAPIDRGTTDAGGAEPGVDTSRPDDHGILPGMLS